MSTPGYTKLNEMIDFLNQKRDGWAMMTEDDERGGGEKFNLDEFCITLFMSGPHDACDSEACFI